MALAGCQAQGSRGDSEDKADAETEQGGGSEAGGNAPEPQETLDAAAPSPPKPDADHDAGLDSASGGKPFCLPQNFRLSAKDGITDLPALGLRIPVDSSNLAPSKGTAAVGSMQSQVLAQRIDYTVHVPAAYDQAESVALMVYSPVYDDVVVRRNFDRLMAGGEMPPTLVVFPKMDWTSASDAGGDNIRLRAGFLADELFPHLKATYAKLSTQAAWHGVGGQSTAGALAFDFAWARPDFFSKVSGDSTSFASFMRWLFPYDQKIDDSRKAQLRVSSTVGESDTGDWLPTNKRVASALITKGYSTRLLVIPKGQHSPANWLPATLDNMRWLWRTEVCP